MGDTAIGKLATKRGLVGGPFGSNLVSRDYVEFGVPVIRGTNMEGPKVGGEFAFVSVEKVSADLSKNTAIPGDLIFTQRGTLGQVAMAERGEFDEYVISQSQMRLRVDEDLADPRFVYFACTAPAFIKQISDNAIATGVPHINLGILARLTIPSFHLEQQRAIAEVLGALDDKIAANNHTLFLLDGWIRTAFRGTVGESRPLGTLASNVRDQLQPSGLVADTVYLGLEHLPKRRMWAFDAGTSSEVTSAKSGFRDGDVLFGKLRPYFHKVVAAGGSGICSTDILVVRAIDPALAGFVLAACASDDAVRACVAASDGTRMPRTSWKDLSAVLVAWPGDNAAHRFSAQVSTKSMLAHSLIKESRCLAQIRDELLPLLMSGRARVGDAEKIVEEVV